jgi:hypothetical protein
VEIEGGGRPAAAAAADCVKVAAAVSAISKRRFLDL